MKKLTMKNLPINERPYEKLMNNGAENLSDSELLAIVIKSGTKEMTSLEISQRLLLECENDINKISKLEIDQLRKFKGIGLVKAIQIKAVLELAKRISKPDVRSKKKIKSAYDVFNLLRFECINETREKIFVISLNVKLDIIKVTRIASGGQTKVSISMKELFLEPIKLEASAIILVHNHPSEDTKPSKSDVEFTIKAIETGKLLNIDVLDHIIISNSNYTSLKDNGII